jgi:hypothetical protein
MKRSASVYESLYQQTKALQKAKEAMIIEGQSKK